MHESKLLIWYNLILGLCKESQYRGNCQLTHLAHRSCDLVNRDFVFSCYHIHMAKSLRLVPLVY